MLTKVATTGFHPVRKVSVVGDIIEQIKSLVQNDHFGPGSRLPNERKLAKQLGVSRPSLREALRTLALMGVLDTRHGSGTQISDSSANILKTPFEFLVMLEPSIEDLYESRELIEVFLAGRAAERRTAEELAVIESCLEGMRAAVTNFAGWTDPDVRFHDAVAIAAHIPVLARILISLNDGIRACIDASWQGHRDLRVVYEIHAAIYEAIRRQDAEAARAAMREHMKAAAAAFRTFERRRQQKNGTARTGKKHRKG